MTNSGWNCHVHCTARTYPRQIRPRSVLPAEEVVCCPTECLVGGAHRSVHGVSIVSLVEEWTYPVITDSLTLFCHSFGIVATLLEIIPFAAIFFSFTNTGKPP